LLLTEGLSDNAEPTFRLEAWPIPLARPWEWIVGIPTGLGILILAIRWLARRRGHARGAIAG
jgi:hypothetical protein